MKPCSLLTYCRRGYNNISRQYFLTDASTGSNSNKCIRTTFNQFLHCYRCRWTTDSCRTYTDLLSLKLAGICDKFPVLCYFYRCCQIISYLFHPSRVARKYYIFPDISFFTLNMHHFFLFHKAAPFCFYHF